MFKKLLFLITALITPLAFSAQAAVGDEFSAAHKPGSVSNTFTYRVLTEPDGSTHGSVELIGVSGGTLKVSQGTTTGQRVLPQTVTYSGETYDVIQIGPYALDGVKIQGYDASGSTTTNKPMPYLIYIQVLADNALTGFEKAGGSSVRFSTPLTTISPKAFIGNKVKGIQMNSNTLAK